MKAAYLTILVKAQDVITHTAGPATLHFMFVSEELLASKASAIIQLTVGQHAKQGALSGIHIANHRHSEHRTKEEGEIWISGLKNVCRWTVNPFLL